VTTLVENKRGWSNSPCPGGEISFTSPQVGQARKLSFAFDRRRSAASGGDTGRSMGNFAVSVLMVRS
jgi:hypothetical protein